MKFLVPFLVVGLFALAGCENQNATPRSEPPQKKGVDVHIQAPGVDVKVKKDKGVDVEAPGTKVKVQPKE
jgi:hypothetical protein